MEFRRIHQIRRWLTENDRWTEFVGARRQVNAAGGPERGLEHWRRALTIIGVDPDAIFEAADAELITPFGDNLRGKVIAVDGVTEIIEPMREQDLPDAIAWVLRHLDDHDVNEREDCPSGEAFSLLNYARSDAKAREQFMTRLVPSIIMPKADRKRRAQAAAQVDGRKEATTDVLKKIAGRIARKGPEQAPGAGPDGPG